jgi:hypothetical protein
VLDDNSMTILHQSRASVFPSAVLCRRVTPGMLREDVIYPQELRYDEFRIPVSFIRCFT